MPNLCLLMDCSRKSKGGSGSNEVAHCIARFACDIDDFVERNLGAPLYVSFCIK